MHPLPTPPSLLPPNEVPPSPLRHSPARLPADLPAEAAPLTALPALRLQQVLATPPSRLPAALAAVVHVELHLQLAEAVAASVVYHYPLRLVARLQPAAQLLALVAGMQTAETPADRLHADQTQALVAALLLLAAQSHVALPQVLSTRARAHAGVLTLP